MNRIWVVAALLAGIALVPRTVGAHDGHVHKIMGTVTARDARHLEVKTPSGENLSIAITAKTVVRRDKRKVSLAEVQTGRRVVVEIGNGEDPLIAGEIQVGATAAGAAAPPAH
jgi:hypothetical protein